MEDLLCDGLVLKIGWRVWAASRVTYFLFRDLSWFEWKDKLEDNIWKKRWRDEDGGVSAPVQILKVNFENCDFLQKKWIS